ncbi:MAG: hypothetical protein Q8O71_01110 [bacterium]|nr:hypothetical protein [bacterium]
MDEFVPILQDLHRKIDTGFAGVYQKIDAVNRETIEHRQMCAMKFGEVSQKFVQIDKDMSVKNAVNGIKDQQEKESRDWWKWIIRGTTGVIAFGMALFIWKLITGSAKIIIGG